MMVARPKIAADLNGLSLYGWSMSIPALVMALVTIIFGKFSDMYGRRIMLMISLTAALIGNILCALSPNFIFLIVASAIAALGAGAMMPLVFAVVGDLFPPSERGKWVGLLNIPLGVFTLTGPVLGGYILETWHWRYLYWLAIPLLVFCLFTVPLGVPSRVNRDSKPEIDVKGCIWAALALSTSIIGFSLTKDHPWLSTHVIGLLGFSLVCWIIFLRVESGAKEPVLDPAVLRNRSFSAVALATFFSSFGTMGMMMYFPMFLQGVQEISATQNGLIITPYGVLAAFMGVPAGYIIDRSGRFKWMYIAGYGILTVSMFALILFNAGTFWGWSLAVALLAGLGYGVIPTINTVVVQNAVPKRLMGVAMGAIFFFLGVGNAVSPAVLDSAMNVTYSKVLSRSLPEGLRDTADEKIMDALDDPQVLLSGSAYEDLEKSLQGDEGTGPQLFQKTVEATRNSLEASMRTIFTIGAILMLLAFLIICTVPGKFNGAEAQQPVPQETEKAGSE
ncbi:MAG: MFS transporter [Acidobacteriota bacterium]